MLRLAEALGKIARTERNAEPLAWASWKQPRRFSVHGDARAVNGVNRTWKTDGGDAVGRNRHGHGNTVVQPDLLNRLGLGGQRQAGNHANGKQRISECFHN